MRRLQRLLQSRIVFNEDILYFSFKKHIFTGKVAQGGLIWKCTWQKPGELAVDIFKHATGLGQQPYIRTFESLTDWTETCIQECLDEYHTRYSSWKRVRHQRTDQPMEVLFKHLQRRAVTPTTEGNKQILLFEQIASQKGHIDVLTSHIQAWMDWYVVEHPSSRLPVPPLVKEPEPETTEPTAAQSFLLHSDEGQFVVLHRLHEVAPKECISWLKKNGPESFKNRLEGVKLCFEPVSAGKNTWKPVDKQTSKRFLHSFFND